MRRVYYAGAEFAASDELALEMLDFAVELEARGATRKVVVPVITSSGADDHVTLILGSPTAMVSTPDPGAAELDMTEAVAEIRRMRAAMAQRRSAAGTVSDAEWALLYDVEY